MHFYLYLDELNIGEAQIVHVDLVVRFVPLNRGHCAL